MMIGRVSQSRKIARLCAAAFMLVSTGRLPIACRSFLLQPTTTTTSLQPALSSAGAQNAFATTTRLFSSTTPEAAAAADHHQTEEKEVDSMRASEIKKELESYGISTRSFLEKKELQAALKKARADGLTPKKKTAPSASSSSSSTSSSSTTTTTSSSSSSSGTSSSDSSKTRQERLNEEMANCQQMKASELKKELQERGVSIKSMFEKSEFVKALAEARVDGVQKATTNSNNNNDEDYAEYANVEVITDDSSGPRQKGQEQKQQQQQQASPFGGGGSPFGGSGSPFGGSGSPFGDMGGLGGIADMLKNMGVGGSGAAGANPFGGGGTGSPFGGGGAGTSPFGGAGGSPFGGAGAGSPFSGMGDAMGKAQELMKNPKVRELMARAQSSPSLMAKVNECMSNPASFAKYANDPEVAELVKELRKYM